MNPIVGICGAGIDKGFQKTAETLGTIMNVSVVRREVGSHCGLDGLIELRCGHSAALNQNTPAAVLRFVAPDEKRTAIPGKEIEFTENAFLPSYLRNRRLVLPEPLTNSLSDTVPGDVVARVSGRPVWKISSGRGGFVMSVSIPPAYLAPKVGLAELFNGETFVEMLPLYLFFRVVDTTPRWEEPQPRACLVVDDPNLHACTYGHIDFRKLVRFSREQPFHAAMATIPLDGWAANPAACRLFREHRDALSLVVHGNDHRYFELARSSHRLNCSALVAESLRQIDSFERRFGLEVDRVMAPPHGVCSPVMLEELWRGGYVGMTTNRWSLWKLVPPTTLSTDFGMRPGALLAGGLPTVNRFRFNSDIATNEIVIARIIGQPIIPYGHHTDFSDDMARLKNVVSVVNAVGNVRWMRMEEILRSNFEHRFVSDEMHIRMYSRQVCIPVPSDVRNLYVEIPGLAGEHDLKLISAGSASNSHSERRVKTQERIPLRSKGSDVQVQLIGPPLPAPVSPKYRGTSSLVRVRRIAAEVRDRLRI